MRDCPTHHGHPRRRIALTIVATLVAVALHQPPAAAAETSSTCGVLIAHRGEHSRWTENSLRAVTAAVDVGADYVEVDVRETKDSALVLMHDRTVDRTTNGSGRVSRMRMSRLRQLRLDDGGRIATLDRALDILRDSSIHVMLEIKKIRSERGFKLFVRRAREFGADRVVVTSFKPRILRTVHRMAPELQRSLVTAEAPTLAQGAEFGSVSAHHKQLTKKWLREMRAAGYPVYAWTLNSETAWTRWNGLVHGITTDEAITFARWRRTAACPVV